MRTVIVIQCTGSDIISSRDPNDYCIAAIKASGITDAIIMAAPDTDESEILKELSDIWDVPLFLGDQFNVAERILSAADSLGADIIVRVLLRQFYIDAEMVSNMVKMLKTADADYVKVPADFNYALCADVCSRSALKKVVATFPQDSIDDLYAASYRFSPWVYMEENPDDFKIVSAQPCADYPPQKALTIREKLARVSGENQTHFEWNYPASSYAFIAERLTENAQILDIACGRGNGCKKMSEKVAKVIGVDLTPAHIDEARAKFGGTPALKFAVGDAETWSAPNCYDAIVSLHTLEHLKNPHAFMALTTENLRAGGELFLEVPILLPHPMQMPLVPYHDKEYERQELIELVRSHNFEIIELWGKNRHTFCNLSALLEDHRMNRTEDIKKAQNTRVTALLVHAKSAS